MATAGEFLAAAVAPSASYQTQTFKALGGSRYEIDGELTLKGVTGRLSHHARILVSGDTA
jgi:polyisoprenoid-binding protein YceI